MNFSNRRLTLSLVFSLWTLICSPVHADLSKLISEITPSVVGVGVLTPIAGNASELQGSGFVFDKKGQYIATNYHVVSNPLDAKVIQHRVIFVGRGTNAKAHRVDIVATDEAHDLAILKLTNSEQTLPTRFTIGKAEFQPPGTEIAFTGFPIGAALGLFPATHRGIVAAITPDSTPTYSTRRLDTKLINRLSKSFEVYQLDATAFPGNSGSPLYLQESGTIIGIINKVFVQGGKENALSTPSGITYAIPVKYLRELAKANKIPI